MSESPEPLVGNVTAGVVRIGDTVRRPVGPWTDAVDALLLHLSRIGFDGAPEPLGRDDQGRQVLEFVPGEVGDPAGTYVPGELAAIGRRLREFHDAVASFEPPVSATWNRLIPPDVEEIIGHNDAAPWNLVRSGRGWVLIDWDAAAPASRLWDVAYAAQSMAGLAAARPAADAAARLRAFVDGYDADDVQRSALPALLGRRARAMYDMLRSESAANRQPWARIWIENGPFWRDTADFLDRHVSLWSACLS